MSVIARIMNDYGLSLSKVAEITGYDRTTISLLKNNKYDGQAAKVEAECIKKLMEAGYVLKETKLKVNQHVFILTENVRRFNDLCDELIDPESDLTSSFGLVVGRAGRGKTKAAIHYAVEHPEAVYVLFIDGMSMVQVVREISYELNGTRPRLFMECIEEISKAAKRRKRLVLMDEADKMPKKYIEMLRGINERCLLPMILIGEESITKKLEERRLKSRVRRIVEFEPISITDVTLFYKTALGVEIEQDAARELLKRAEGDFRVIVRDAHSVVRIMNASSVYEVTLDVVRAL